MTIALPARKVEISTGGRKCPHKRVLLVFVALVGATVAVGCANHDAPAERIGVSASAIVGGDTHDVSASQSLPERAVVQVVTPFSICTGSVIERDRILLAAHCFCNKMVSPATFNPTPTAGQIGVYIPSVSQTTPVGTNSTRAPAIYFSDAGSFRLCNPPSTGDESRAISDLAILFLQANLSVAQVPEVLHPYIGGDFLDRIFNRQQTFTFFGRPWLMMGYAGSRLPSAVLLQGSAHDLEFEHDCDLFGGDCSGYWVDQHRTDGTANPQGGDSGGPITFMQDGLTPTSFGVLHGDVLDPFEGREDLWSATWDNGSGNGSFIAQFLHDADHDGVDDEVDNCAPQNIRLCGYDPSRCYNPDQVDADKDGVGDTCDNCAPSVCARRAWPTLLCANADQNDGDGDETGDVCDSCPLTRNGSGFITTSDQFLDADSDGVGDACDNCSKPN